MMNERKGDDLGEGFLNVYLVGMNHVIFDGKR